MSYLYDSYPPARVKHIPIKPPRKCTPGEGIYLQLWQEWATARPREWYSIFQTRGPVRQRAASVAASFMVFMGCSGGRCFTYTAERFAKELIFNSREGAFRAAWAIENMRSRGINHGLRTSEYMLAPEHPINSMPGYPGGVITGRVPCITQEDNDILESMVVWWSREPAEIMRSIAEPMIEAANRRAASQMFAPEEA